MIDVQVGDWVLIETPRGFGKFSRRVAQVERVTKTQFHAGGYNWTLRCGKRVGEDGFQASRVDPITPEQAERIIAAQKHAAGRFLWGDPAELSPPWRFR